MSASKYHSRGIIYGNARYVRSVAKRYSWFRETALSIINDELASFALPFEKKDHLLDIQQRIESKDLAASIAAIAKICATAKGLDLPPEIRLMLLIALEVN
jgi:hypothetical protein